jgi:hypothetical protein
MEWIEENGWEVLNGNKQGDEEGEWTYVGSRGETVIDYAIVNEEAWERVEIMIEGTNHEDRGEGDAREEQKKVTIKVWDGRGVEEYRRRGESKIWGAGRGEDGGRAERIDRESDAEKGGDSKGIKGVGRKNWWWDRECEQLKKQALRALREWGRNNVDRSRILEAKRWYKERCREKKRYKREREAK